MFYCFIFLLSNNIFCEICTDFIKIFQLLLWCMNLFENQSSYFSETMILLIQRIYPEFELAPIDIFPFSPPGLLHLFDILVLFHVIRERLVMQKVCFNVKIKFLIVRSLVPNEVEKRKKNTRLLNLLFCQWNKFLCGKSRESREIKYLLKPKSIVYFYNWNLTEDYFSLSCRMCRIIDCSNILQKKFKNR